jgi:hypothetical protein
MERDEVKRRMWARVSGGRADFEQVVRGAVAQVLATPVERLVPRASADAIVAAHLDPARLAALVHPIFRGALVDLHAASADDARPLETWVPEATRRRMERLVARPGWVDKSYIEAFFKEPAIEALLADTLYSAMRDFTTTLPKLVMAALPTGRLGMFGAAAGIGAKLAEELERRLEPELKAFLGTGTKRALEQAARFAVARADDPPSLELRKNILRFVLHASPKFHLRPIDASVLAEVDTIAGEIAAHVATLPESRAYVAKLLDRFYATHGAGTVDALLRAIGHDAALPVDAWIEATWPAVQVLLEGPEVRALVDRLVDETLDLAAG